MQQQRAVVGTAGHIDHGKTSLLEALTGVDCDRWAEEKARGITIDLGFTHMQMGDLQVGFVDVPGHEKFLHNALAGLGGIRLVLLVVAADEGVELQTREHLAICELLEIPRAVVALTKSDLVDTEMLELAQLEVAELLEGTRFYADAPILPVSSVTGDGLEALRDALAREARSGAAQQEDSDSFLRLPVDRAFQLRGLGAVVTGTLIAGRVEPGQSVAVMPRGVTARVRSVQVHGGERPRAEAGERTAVQLVGVDLEDLERGEQLVRPESVQPSTQMAARCRLLSDAPLKAIEGWTPIRLHHFASEVTGRMRPLDGDGALLPGGEGLVEIRLERPVVAVRGDRFVVRRPSPAATLGGGVVLDPAWRRRRGAEAARAASGLSQPETSLELWVAETGERGVSAAELAPRLGQKQSAVAAALDARVSDGKLLRLPAGKAPRYVDPPVVPRLIERAREILKRFFAEDRLATGMPKAEFIARLLPERARDLSAVYLRFLADAKVAAVSGDLVNPPGRHVEAQLTGDEQNLSSRLLAAIEAEGLTPPSPPELARQLGAKPQILEGVQTYLIRQKKLIRLPSGLIVSAKAFEEMRRQLEETGWERFAVPQFKDHFGLSRKWAIPLLEQLDSAGATRRFGNERLIVTRRQESEKEASS
ncbi:MAG: selenocysteine-specific translation elongation factor [Acidobacteriota bacterium]